MTAVTGGDASFKRIAKFKSAINAIDWIVQNDALANREAKQHLLEARRLLTQEIIMIDHGL